MRFLELAQFLCLDEFRSQSADGEYYTVHQMKWSIMRFASRHSQSRQSDNLEIKMVEETKNVATSFSLRMKSML